MQQAALAQTPSHSAAVVPVDGEEAPDTEAADDTNPGDLELGAENDDEEEEKVDDPEDQENKDED